MAKPTPVRLSDFVRELPPETRIVLFMENLTAGTRRQLTDGTELPEQRNSLLKQFADAVVGTVIKAGTMLRVVYLDETKSNEFAASLTRVEAGQQLTF